MPQPHSEGDGVARLERRDTRADLLDDSNHLVAKDQAVRVLRDVGGAATDDAEVGAIKPD